MRARTPVRRVSIPAAIAILAACAPAIAGTIDLAWDPVAGAAGYRVYYGTSPGNYTQHKDFTTTAATLTNLTDCTTWYVAVKAYNGAGESPSFSNELSGWARPEITGATPSAMKQGDQTVVNISGKNFQPGATIQFGDPPKQRLYQASVVTQSCNAMQLVLTADPPSRHIPPAKAEKTLIEVVNPDDVFGQRSNAFEILINPARFDVNQSDNATLGAIDGKDLVWLLRVFRSQEGADPSYDPDFDFDGDGWVDGNDLAFIASNFGFFWSGSAWTPTRPSGTN